MAETTADKSVGCSLFHKSKGNEKGQNETNYFDNSFKKVRFA